MNIDINLIAAKDQDDGIGKNGKLPWFFKEDLAFFKKMTNGGCVLMGRKTWDSLPKKPLPNRINVVLSTRKIENIETFENVSIFDNLKDAMEFCKKLNKNIWIIGGRSLYKECMDKCIPDKLYINNINGSFDCDVFFPVVPKNYKLEHTIETENICFTTYSLDRQNKSE
jgi:dihydrofolate reductase